MLSSIFIGKVVVPKRVFSLLNDLYLYLHVYISSLYIDDLCFFLPCFCVTVPFHRFRVFTGVVTVLVSIK